MSGKALELRFLLPSRLDSYGFQVQRLREDPLQGTPTECRNNEARDLVGQ